MALAERCPFTLCCRKMGSIFDHAKIRAAGVMRPSKLWRRQADRRAGDASQHSFPNGRHRPAILCLSSGLSGSTDKSVGGYRAEKILPTACLADISSGFKENATDWSVLLPANQRPRHDIVCCQNRDNGILPRFNGLPQKSY